MIRRLFLAFLLSGAFFFAHAQSVNWRAKWIEIGYKEDTLRRPAQYFLKTFMLSGKVRSARLIITSRGLYEASLNGGRVGEAYLTPGWTSYHKRLQYQVYDVGASLKKGANQLQVVLGNGWYRGYIGWEGKRDIYGKSLALLCQLEIVFGNGKRQTIISDENWKSGEGEIGENDLLNGASFNANRLPSFKHPVKVLGSDYKGLTPGNEVSVTRHESFDPKLIVTPSGEQVLDFGQNLTGHVLMRVQGNKGDKVTLTHGEVLDRAGNFYAENMRAAKTVASFVLSGKKEETYEPHFTYFGFRYVKVSGLEKVDPKDFKAVALYADMKPAGSFECSNPLLNQLQHNILWGQKSNFTDVPTDCPQRDEKLGWTGDAQIFCRTACFNFDVNAFFSKWLGDMALDQKWNGAVPLVVPNILDDSYMPSAGWSDASTVVPWTMYEVYGDRALLERQYASMKAWVEYIRNHSKNNLWNTGLHYGDWLSFRSVYNREYTAHTDMYLIAQAFYAHSTELVLKAAQTLGQTEDIKTYSALFEKIKQAFCLEYLTPNGMVSSNTQTAYVLALHFDLLPVDMRAVAAKRLVENISSYNNHITTGVIGTPYICHVLSRFGYADVAYQLLLQDSYPSWLYPVKMGATTIWERWDGIRPDGSLQTPSMNSFNHYAYGAIGDWMYQNILGIQLAAPGYKKVLIRPLLGGGLSWAKGAYSCSYGKISVNWKIAPGKFIMDVEIPHGVTAVITVPNITGTPVKEVEVSSGKFHYES